jgi:hypothetical protein
MLAVLNQADLLAPDALGAARADLERLLAADGLRGVPVLAVSAATGAGLAELRAEMARRVRARAAAVERLGADVTTVAGALGAACGGRPRGVSRETRARLLAALAEAAGVPSVVRAVAAAHRRRGVLATGWPFVRWIRRLRPDPLRRLRLGDAPAPDVHTSLPGPSGVQLAQVESAARGLAADASAGLGGRWPALVRAAATSGEQELPARLDRAVAGADLHARPPRWWRVAGLLQGLLALAVAAGALWLLALVALAYLRLDDVVPVPEVRGVAVPTWLLLGGAAAGVLLGLLARIVNGAAAARRARAAERSLRRRVAEVGEELVVAPVAAELAAYERLCGLVADAAAPRRRLAA